jgi:Glycosyl transferase family 2
MSNLPNNVAGYLKKFATNDWVLEIGSLEKIKNVIVVPAISEYKNIISLLLSLADNYKDHFETTVVIFVINNSETSGSEIKMNNAKSLQFITSLIKNKEIDLPSYTKIMASGIRLGLIDASSKEKALPEKQNGVGLARKIGMDMALRIFDYTDKKKNIIISLDADCEVERNYLNEIVNRFNENNFDAAVVNYQHKIDNKKINSAIICYEIFIRYYVLGLKHANSSFAFHSIGSTVVCDHHTYIKVGGMNKRKAGEDFYFLEKAAKITQIRRINETTIYPSSRSSWRVPFGTGQRVKRFTSNRENEYLLYNPKTFTVLKDWLELFNKEMFISAEDFLCKAKIINEHLYDFLSTNNFKEVWNKILNNSKNNLQLEKQKINWFDGFKTLKLIHYLRDNGLPSINMFDAMDKIFAHYNMEVERDKVNPIPDIKKQIEYLEILRKLDK